MPFLLKSRNRSALIRAIKKHRYTTKSQTQDVPEHGHCGGADGIIFISTSQNQGCRSGFVTIVSN